ncbi:MAG: Yip1 family protein [bacterium]
MNINIFERAKAIVLRPLETWQEIKGETIPGKQLFINYAAPLALIPTVCSLIGMTLIGIRMPAGDMLRIPFLTSLSGEIAAYVVGLLGIWIGAWVMKSLASFFGAKSDLELSLKVMIFSLTPAWLVGVFALIPGLAILTFVGILYTVYLLTKGLSIVLETPDNKVILYTAALLVLGAIINFFLSGWVMSQFYGPMYLKALAG